MKYKPGELCDKNGVPIEAGDLLRSFHFYGRRRRKHYLYHTATWNREHETLEMVPTCHLEPGRQKSGGRCWLSPELSENCEVIYGHGPGDYLDYTERPRRNGT